MTTTTYVCSFTEGLDEMPRAHQRCLLRVAKHLARVGRFSIFEATDNLDIARTMDSVFQHGWFDVLDRGGYPWTYVALNERGRRALRLPEVTP